MNKILLFLGGAWVAWALDDITIMTDGSIRASWWRAAIMMILGIVLTVFSLGTDSER